jgi:serine/threonine protein kinase
MLRHANEAPRPLFDFDQEIPESVQEIVSKLLAKLPSDRFDSAEEAAERLAEIVPPKTLPELDPVNAEFLEWLRTGQNDAPAGELQDVGYEPEFQEFLDFVSVSRFEAVMSQRPTF